MKIRSILLFCCCALIGVCQGGAIQTHRAEPVAQTSPSYFFGKVVPAGPDRAASADSLALVADNGRTYVLLNDDGSRMFFKDKRLLNRPMRLTGKLDSQSQMLQVSVVHSILDSKLHEVYYWCETCKLRYSEPGICTCCGAQTELIEEPVQTAK